MAEVFKPDFRQTLTELHDQWSSCQACSLGISRIQVGGSFVFGEGDLGGLMLIGEGPGREEELQGRPFIGPTGTILRSILEVLQFSSVYITNAVCCRSWDYAYDPQGNKRTRFNKRAGKEEYIIQDDPPKNPQLNACRPRLLQQIYLVDPILIVTLGGKAAEILLNRKVTITTDSGKLFHMEMPGASVIPQLTPKGAWARYKGAGTAKHLITPVQQHIVKYPVIPLVHPAYAKANEKDQRRDAPMSLLLNGFIDIHKIYTTYMHEVHGHTLPYAEPTIEDLKKAISEDNEESNFD